MTLRKQILMRKFFESMFGIRRSPYLFRFDNCTFAEYNRSLMHRRINERARLHSMYNTRLIASTVGMVINALLYRINDNADSLLIRK